MLRHFRRWRFETPEMEAEFQAQMDTFVVKTFNVWCILLFLFVVFILGMCYTMPRPSFMLILPYLLVLVLLFCLLTFMNCAPASKRYIPTVLPLVCTTVIGTIGWSVDGLVAQATLNVFDLHLTHTLPLLQSDADAEAELTALVRQEVSTRIWYLIFLIMYIIVDAMRLTGTTYNALYVHFIPVITVVVVTYCSDNIDHTSVDVVVMGFIFIVYTLSSSLHMAIMFRDRFRFDYHLRQRMVKEAEVMEAAKNVEVAQRQASQKADTMLNHILKNIMADAYGCIDLFFGQRYDDHLHRAQESLERGMRWCKKRQVMVQVNSGDYTPVLVPTALQKLVDGMVYGRVIAVGIPDVTVCLDSLLCEVVLDNAISNALRHGDPSLGPISLVVTATPGKEHSLAITFTLTNYVPHDQSPVTPELVSELVAGHDVGLLVTTSALSDHLGLRHMFLAAAAHHMTASLEQVGNLVTFTASFEADLDDDSVGSEAEAAVSIPSALSSTATFPTGLWIICLDDSEIARRVLLHGFATHAPQTVSQAYGATEEEVVTFEAAALNGADIVILDQHLDYHHVTLYGTDIAQRLRQGGYTGLICVRSANTTDEDEAVYLRSGADCMIGKDLPLRALVESLQQLYQQHVHSHQNTRSTMALMAHRKLPQSSTEMSLSFSSNPGV